MTAPIQKPVRSTARGFSLIEVMISLLMAGLLTIIMGNVFIAAQVTRNAATALSEVQNNGRIAMMWLQHDVRMSGHISRTHARSPIKITNVAALVPAITNNCFTTANQAFDWALAILPLPTGDPAPMVFGVDNVTVANNVFGGCIDGADLQAGSDIFSMHYATALDVEDADLVDGNIYIDTGIGGMVIFQCDEDGAACKGNLTDARTDPSGSDTHTLAARGYFVRSWGNVAGDGIPTLVRFSLQPNGTVIQEPLIQGITNLQVTYGVDTDSDGFANRYLSAAQLPAFSSSGGAVAWARVKSVKFAMLMQSTTPDVSRDATNQTFDVGGTNVQLSGSLVGKVFSTTVAVRNPAIRNAS
ncbi:MAG: PilW family protein [Gammaproteobacteria bacterium]|nr:PilW family protein [Gammaproteobacteria bacterium]